MFSLRLVEEKDLRFLLKIRQDPEVNKNLGAFFLSTMKKQKKWFESVEKDSSKMYLIFKKDNKKIGYVRCTEIDYINKSICVGGDIHKKYRGKGYAKEMYKLIFDLAFNKMNLNRVWLFVLKTNERAIHIYEKVGFKQEGRQEEAVWKDGKYIDYIMMSILRKDYNRR